MREKQLKNFVETTDIEVPEERIMQLADHLASEVLYNKRYESMITGRLMASDQFDDMAEQVQSEAYEQAKTQLVLEEVIKREDFGVSEEDLEAEVRALSERLDIPEEAVRDFLGEDMDSLKDDILIKKAIDFVTDSH